MSDRPGALGRERLKQLSPAEKRALLARLLEQERRPPHDLPLSHGQRALWFLQQFAPHSAAYNVSLAARIRSPLDAEALQRAFQGLVDRHELLRATFPSRDGDLVTLVRPAQPVAFAMHDASTWSDTALATRLRDDAHQPFDLERGPVFRVSLFRRAASDHLLLVTVHHIVYDAVSLVVLLDELGALYAAESAGRPATLPPVRTRYADYVRWQTAMLAAPDGERLWAYWRDELAGELPDLNLPTDRPRPPLQTFRGAAQVFAVDDNLTKRLKALAASRETTVFVVLLAAFQVLLHRYTGQSDIRVGTPMIGRTRPEFRAIVGYFINPVVLRADLSDDPAFSALLAQARRRVLGALQHQDYPFSLLVERLQPDRDTSRSPLFQAMFNMPSAHRLDAQSVSQFLLGTAGGVLRLGGLEMEVFPVEQQTAMFDLLLSMVEADGRLVGSLQYDADLFEPETIERMVGHFQTLLQGIVAAPDQRVSTLPLLRDGERQRILVEWNATARPYPREHAFPALFDAQVERTPEAVAATCGERGLTYRELNAQANRLARVLVQHGVARDVVVALLAERGLEFLTAVLAVMKAGGAYLPLDPRHPAQRHVQVLTQSRSPLVLAARAFHPMLEAALLSVSETERPRVIVLEEALRSDAAVSNLGPRSGPGDLAYVIYTSGSTGTPKGAMVTQRGMVNHLYAKIGALRLDQRDVVAQTASQCFDISVWQSLVALLAGGRTRIVVDDVAKDPMALLAEVERHGITVLETVPSLLLMMVEGAATRGATRPALDSLRWMVPTGEALPPELCRAWFRLYPQIPLVNAYGPTECSDDVTHHFIYAPPAAHVVHMPIGRPIANTRLYIVDGHQQPVPIGVIGELCVAGDGVGRGYLNDPVRTAEAFVPDPFVAEPGARMYRTGDLARYLPDGTIEFLGRRDQQVKIRGFRIELGEVESALDRHPDVRDCAVIARDDGPGRKRLVAYVVPADGTPAPADLRGFLKDRLPDYMVPSAFVVLDALPLTPNGKLDRRALPAPPAEAAEPDASYAAPRTATEATLAGIWARVLGLERVGIHDNFFAVGGDSIQSIRILARAAQAGVTLSPTQFFQYQTVAEQAAAADAARTAQGEATPATTASPPPLLTDDDRTDALRRLGLTPEAVEAVYPLAPMQRMMLAHTLRQPASGVYVEQLRCTIRGDLDADAFVGAWTQAVQRHAVLRTRFVWDRPGEPLQVVVRAAPPEWVRRDLRNLSSRDRERALRTFARDDVLRGFRLADSPPVRFALFQTGPDAHHFIWSLHHLLMDAWSGGVLLREVFDLYDAVRYGRGVRLDAPKPYEAYVAWVRTQDGDAAAAYWRRTLEGIRAPGPFSPAVESPLPGRESPSGNADDPDGDLPYGEVRRHLAETTTAALQALARAQRLTLNTLVQAAWALVLSRLGCGDDVVFGVTSSGRPAALPGVESMVGLFINTLPMRVRITRDAPIVAWLRRVQDAQTETRQFEHIALDVINEWIASPAGEPLFDTVVRFQNFPVDAALRQRVGGLRLDDVRFLDLWAYSFCLIAEPGEVLTLSATFDRRIVGARQAAAVLADLGLILTRMAADPSASVGDLLGTTEAGP